MSACCLNGSDPGPGECTVAAFHAGGSSFLSHGRLRPCRFRVRGHFGSQKSLHACLVRNGTRHIVATNLYWGPYRDHLIDSEPNQVEVWTSVSLGLLKWQIGILSHPPVEVDRSRAKKQLGIELLMHRSRIGLPCSLGAPPECRELLVTYERKNLKLCLIDFAKRFAFYSYVAGQLLSQNRGGEIELPHKKSNVSAHLVGRKRCGGDVLRMPA
jgi:hypothetical protein